MQRITYRVKVSAQGAKRRISHLLRPAKRTLNTESNIVSSVHPITPTVSARFAKTKKWHKYLVLLYSPCLLTVSL